ncbi:hypothetical protein CCMA1212_002921 [Trichoderma ghanense]|uniref:Uncharacterized protein n=1 Tax=Trichoderma ghanense TaxID=65468 RepID=A0ABY2HAS5_9HYPO
MGSLDLEVEEAGFTSVGGPARFVAELLEYVSPVDLRSSSFGFPSMDMLADLPLVWIDGLVTVVDGGYLLVTADFSFLAATSFVVASVIALARRPGMGPPAGGGALAPLLVPVLVLPVPVPAVFLRLEDELLGLEAVDAARALCLRLGSRVGEADRGTEASRELDVRVGIEGMPVAERIERERGIDDDIGRDVESPGGLRRGFLEEMDDANRCKDGELPN